MPTNKHAAAPQLEPAKDAWVMAKPNDRAQRHVLSLTGPGSHVVWIEPGIGNMYIGCEKQSRSTPQAIVEPNARLEWGGLETRPRWLRYEGNDTSILDWLRRREKPLERLQLRPRGPFEADATGANVIEIVIEAMHGHPIRLILPSTCEVRVEGDASLVALSAPSNGASLDYLEVALPGRGGRAPFFDGLADVRGLTVRGVDFDPSDLSRYRELRELTMNGPSSDLASLRELRKLEQLTLVEAWDLSSFPSLDAWPNLRALAFNYVRKSDAERLERAAKDLPAIELRIRDAKTEAWIANRPRFEHWGVSAAALKIANRAYVDAKKSLAALKKPDAKRARAAVEAFVDALNAIDAKKALLTLEREDAAAAIDQLFAEKPLAELADDARTWFDARREF